MHHSDRGSQYASKAFQRKLKKYSMICSMSRKGNSGTMPQPKVGSTASRTSECEGLRFVAWPGYGVIELFYTENLVFQVTKFMRI